MLVEEFFLDAARHLSHDAVFVDEDADGAVCVDRETGQSSVDQDGGHHASFSVQVVALDVLEKRHVANQMVPADRRVDQKLAKEPVHAEVRSGDLRLLFVLPEQLPVDRVGVYDVVFGRVEDDRGQRVERQQDPVDRESARVEERAENLQVDQVVDYHARVGARDREQVRGVFGHVHVAHRAVELVELPRQLDLAFLHAPHRDQAVQRSGRAVCLKSVENYEVDCGRVRFDVSDFLLADAVGAHLGQGGLPCR